MTFTRRKVLASMGLAGLGATVAPFVWEAGALPVAASSNDATTCPFKLAVINDEITQDFEKACKIVSGDFGLHWIELRSMWNKNVTELSEKDRRMPGRFSKNTSSKSPTLRARCSRQTGRERRDLQAERKARPVPRRLRCQRARQAARALHFAGEVFPNGPHSLLRFLAAG